MTAKVEKLTRGKRKRPGGGKGRAVDAVALAEVRALLGDKPRVREELIEHLHALQDAYGRLSAAHIVALAEEMKLASVEVFETASFYHHFDVVRQGEEQPPALTVRVCDSVSCALAGAESLLTTLQHDLGPNIRVQRVPCVGRCDSAPVAMVNRRPVTHATPGAVVEVIDSGEREEAVPSAPDFAAYQAGGGYRLVKALDAGEITGESIIEALEHAGLRGLGGAGFPAGRKWRILRDQDAPRLLAINIDEGEPGTFKDLYYLSRDPHRFLEGMLVAARVVGIDTCYLYVRDEYPALRELLAKSLAELREQATFALPDMILRRGAGAYICGEESAMIESLEGKRGMPRLRPPYVAEVGLFGRPTLEHNCETLFWVRELIDNGPEAFAAQGRRDRKGLRSFSVSGRVARPGVHLAPAGISVRELIDEYCGGMAQGHSLYGYFPGGASGGILPASLADLPLDFDTLQPYGCFIGSAAIIVLSDQDSARDAALNAMRFFAHESCGQCTPCRVGTEKAADLMARDNWDLDLLEDLASVMEDASICGLGQAAPNPLRSVIKYFSHELGITEVTDGGES